MSEVIYMKIKEPDPYKKAKIFLLIAIIFLALYILTFLFPLSWVFNVVYMVALTGNVFLGIFIVYFILYGLPIISAFFGILALAFFLFARAKKK